MPDKVTPEVRSRMMARVRSKDTKPELVIRRGLHRMGFRFRLHGRGLPGRPDLVFRSRKAVILVNGCFWHGHACHMFRWPGTRADFWRAKIGTNICRDACTRDALVAMGWRVCEIWECTLKGRERLPLDDVLALCATFLSGNESTLSIGSDQTVTVPDCA